MPSIAEMRESLIQSGIHPESGQPIPQELHQSGFLQSVAQHPLTQMALSAIDVPRRTVTEWANKIPGVNIPNPDLANQEGLPHTIGTMLGDVATYAPMAAVAGPEKAMQMVAGGAYGAFTHPEHPIRGALMGAGLSGLAEAAPEVLNYIKPAKYAKEIVNTLGQGAKNLEENAKALASDVRASAVNQRQLASQRYNDVLKDVGSNPFEISEAKSLRDIDADNFPMIKKKYYQFLSNRTIGNAHELQSDIGKQLTQLAKKPKTFGEDKEINKLREIHSDLKKDIEANLENAGPRYLKNYKKATEFYKENAAIYNEDPYVRKLANKITKNPENVHTIFKSPEPATEKVMEHLGERGKNRILYSALGNPRTPEQLIEKAKELEGKHLLSSVSPEFKKDITALENQVRRRDVAKQVGKMGLGATGAMGLGHAFGIHNPIAEAALGIGGAKYLLSHGKTGRAFPEMAESHISNALKRLQTTSPFIKQLMLSTLIPQGQ